MTVGIIEAALFFAFADLLGRPPVLRPRPISTCILAAVVSLFPFALSITTLDLILGFPELGGAIVLAESPGQTVAVTEAGSTRVGSFLRELVYLSDNHFALCLLLSAPRLLPELARSEESPASEWPLRSVTTGPPGVEKKDVHQVMVEADTLGYQRHLDRPLEGTLMRVEAQEHYVRLISQSDTQMALYRFNDIVSELSPDLGMQVHRSHWVAFAAVRTLSREGGGRLFLVLKDGSRIPVSRKYAEPAGNQFSEAAFAKGAVT